MDSPDKQSSSGSYGQGEISESKVDQCTFIYYHRVAEPGTDWWTGMETKFGQLLEANLKNKCRKTSK